MFITTHIAVGSIVGLATGNPIAAFVAGIASHHALDIIPHNDVGSGYTKGDEPESLADLKPWEKFLIIADLILGLIILLILLIQKINPAIDVYIADLWTKSDTLVFLGALGAFLPDILYQIGKAFKKKIPYFSQGIPFVYYNRLHEKLHHTAGWYNWYYGLTVQIVLIGFVLWWFLR